MLNIQYGLILHVLHDAENETADYLYKLSLCVS